MSNPNEKEKDTAELQAQELTENNENDNDYTFSEIKRYEIMLEKMFLSTGGKDTTKLFADMLKVQKGHQVLDIGSGIGGSSFYIAETYQAKVLGVDLSGNMICQAKKYLMEMNEEMQENIEFQNCDITKMEFKDNSFDFVHCRETTMYIQDKELLFSKFLKWLKPGGKLLINDYCHGKTSKSEDFLTYAKKRGFHLRTIGEQEATLKKVGFKDVKAEDRTNECVKILRNDLDRFMRDKHEILNSITRVEYDEIVSLWELKLIRCKAGDQAWGLFIGTKNN